MTDGSSLEPTKGDDDTTVYRPSADGGLEAAPAASGDYRDQLQSRRWRAAPLKNPEVDKTEPRIAVVALLLLAGLTLVVLVLGYGSGFWG